MPSGVGMGNIYLQHMLMQPDQLMVGYTRDIAILRDRDRKHNTNFLFHA